MKKTDNPLKLGSQCVLDWDNVIDLTFKSNGQIISIHRNEKNELEIAGVGVPTSFQECLMKTSKHFKDIMERADKCNNQQSFQFLQYQQELTKAKEDELKKEVEELNNLDETPSLNEEV